MAANAGVGYRILSHKRVYGLNAYYDYRNTNYLSYNQLGVGIESLGEVWDFRLNGYFPVGSKLLPSSDATFAQFSGILYFSSKTLHSP